MKRVPFLSVVFTVLILCSFKCEAQMSLVFKRLDIINVNSFTNLKTTYDELIRYGDFSSGISVFVTAELMNSGDSTLHFNEDIDNIKMAICFYDIFNNVWKKVDLYTSRSRVSGNVQVIGSLDPEDGLLMRRGVILPASLFLQERPLYYLSSIVPTMYLILEIPGYEPLYSEKSDVIEIFLNGERINSKRTRCYSCGELYMMLHHNEVMEEFILVNYGNNISNYLLGKAFMCNFDFTRRLLPIATHP